MWVSTSWKARPHHDGRYVEWARIQRIEPGRVLITGSVKDLPEPGPST